MHVRVEEWLLVVPYHRSWTRWIPRTQTVMSIFIQYHLFFIKIRAASRSTVLGIYSGTYTVSIAVSRSISLPERSLRFQTALPGQNTYSNSTRCRVQSSILRDAFGNRPHIQMPLDSNRFHRSHVLLDINLILFICIHLKFNSWQLPIIGRCHLQHHLRSVNRVYFASN